MSSPASGESPAPSPEGFPSPSQDESPSPSPSESPSPLQDDSPSPSPSESQTPSRDESPAPSSQDNLSRAHPRLLRIAQEGDEFVTWRSPNLNGRTGMFAHLYMCTITHAMHFYCERRQLVCWLMDSDGNHVLAPPPYPVDLPVRHQEPSPTRSDDEYDPMYSHPRMLGQAQADQPVLTPNTTVRHSSTHTCTHSEVLV